MKAQYTVIASQRRDRFRRKCERLTALGWRPFNDAERVDGYWVQSWVKEESMRKIYVVVQGSYSDYGIEGVFDDKSLAQKFAATLSGEDPRVEEYELNQQADALRSGRVPFVISGYYNKHDELCYYTTPFAGDFVEGVTVKMIEAWNDSYPQYTVGVYADSVEAAAKIAMEKITLWKAMNPNVFDTGGNA